jgi:hypothetical protein
VLAPQIAQLATYPLLVADDAQRTAAELPGERTEVTGTDWQGRIVAIGGLDADGGTLDDVHLYDPADDAWTPAPPLPDARHHTAVTTLDDRLYVVGGYNASWAPQATVWSLGAGEDSWREEPPLDTPRGALAVAATAAITGPTAGRTASMAVALCGWTGLGIAATLIALLAWVVYENRQLISHVARYRAGITRGGERVRHPWEKDEPPPQPGAQA